MTARLQDSSQPFQPQSGPLRLVLASGSASRARMLRPEGTEEPPSRTRTARSRGLAAAGSSLMR